MGLKTFELVVVEWGTAGMIKKHTLILEAINKQLAIETAQELLDLDIVSIREVKTKEWYDNLD